MDSRDRRDPGDYLTADVEATLADALDDAPEVSEERAHEVFRAQCVKFEELFKDDTPASVIRRLATHQTERYLEDGEVPDHVEPPDE